MRQGLLFPYVPPEPKLPGFADLFAGIHGFKGLEEAGHKHVCNAEIDVAACKVLEHRCQDVPNLGDVRKIGQLPKGIELVCAGFPCTDLSQAGRKAGLYGPASSLGLRLVQIMAESHAPVLLVEQVANMRSLGKGSAMESFIAPLEDLGYRWAYRQVTAQAFGLPQRRTRLLFVFANDGAVDPRHVLFAEDVGKPKRPSLDRWRDRAFSFSWTEGKGGAGWGFGVTGPIRVGSGLGVPSPPAVVLQQGANRGRVVLPGIRDLERLQGFVRDWTVAASDLPAGTPGAKGARHRLIGRAVPPQMIAWVGHNLRAGIRRDVDVHQRKRIEPGKSWPAAGWGGFGTGRWHQSVSEYPIRLPLPDLEQWLDVGEASDLSPRATRGFLKRFKSGRLKRPPGLIEVLERHIDRQECDCSLAA